jgi:hypothetical protein
MQSIALFLTVALITYTTSSNLQAGNKIKTATTTGVQIMTSSEQAVFTAMWNTLFKVPRGTACSKSNLLARIRRQLEEEGLLPGQKYKTQRSKFWWVKQWGYEASAYFFDFLDPLLRDQITKEFQSVFTDLLGFPQADTNIPDPFDFKKLISQGNGNLTKKQLKMLKKFTENYDSAAFDASANLPQIQAAINKWKWQINPGDPTYFRRFVQNYDMNFDGRLNPREFILASLWNNKQTVGSSLCDHCFFEVGKTLDAIFLYLDCDNDGLLSSEEIWGNLPNIKRDTEKWNMFAFGNDQSIRTAAINDFILKNSKTKEGFITRNEFRVGILLGFWDRQTETTKILKADERTLKNLRWEEGDMIDIALYNYYKKKMMSGAMK